MSRGAVERVLGVLAALAAAALVVLGLLVAPPDAVQGQAQRLMYVHVPAAWVAYLAFAAVLVCSVAYLVRRDLAWDRRAQAAAELGVGLTGLAIMLGSIWGRPVWGVWWTWDPRLVTTVVLLLVYVGYLGVRGLAVDAHVNARRAAVVGVAGFVNVPLVHFSVVWWRTLHQPPTVLRPAGPASAIEPVMLVALLAGVVAFTLGAGWLYLRRLRVLARRAAPPPVSVGARPVPSVTVVRGDGE
ncbi:MAG: cytochrome c biogenesis protein CcsA [Actinobacteria bacterium]|nr:cytochrome c biogenesis protein CcsA [Actinomycetota bacterium]